MIVPSEVATSGENRRAPVPVAYVVGALVVGGAERQLLLLLENLDRARFEPHVIAFEGGAWEYQFRERAVSVEIVGFGGGRARALIGCWRHLRRLRPTIVHTIGRTANYVGRVAAIAAGVPTIVMSERSAAFIRTSSMICLDRLLAPLTTHMISNSRHAATFLLEKAIASPTKLSVIANGIEASRYRPVFRDRLELEIGNIGELRWEKNQADLLRAVARLTRLLPETTLRIAGDGSLRGYLEALSIELGIGPNVSLCGWVENVPKFLSSVGVYVHCSKYEGLPNALMEAMVSGLPCVAYDTTGCRELIEHMRTGVLVEDGNVDALAEGVLGIARSPDLARALGRAARSSIVEDFAVGGMVEKTCAVYERTLRTERGAI